MNILNPTNDATKRLIEVVQNYELGLLANKTAILRELAFFLYDEEALTGAELDTLIDRIERLPSMKATRLIRETLKNRAQ